MVRTQIYLDEGLKAELHRLSNKRRITVSELIRQALEQYLERNLSRFDEAVEKSFGIWRKRKDIGEASGYVRKIRREWEHRQGRI